MASLHFRFGDERYLAVDKAAIAGLCSDADMQEQSENECLQRSPAPSPVLALFMLIDNYKFVAPAWWFLTLGRCLLNGSLQIQIV